MGAAMEVITGFTTAPDTANFVAATVAPGDSFGVRSAPMEAGVYLMQAWMDAQGKAGVAGFRVRSPRLHDNVRGITADIVPSEVDPALPWGIKQRLIPQDTLTLEIIGSNTAGDIESVSMLLYYDDLPGVNARLARWAEIEPRVKNIVSVENTLALGVAGGYSGPEAINAETDLLKANTDYALLGYVTTVECCTIGWRGVDTGNLRIGGPGNELDHQLTVDWFRRMSQETGMACVPIFNSANKAGILIDGVQDENGADPTVISYFAELG